MDRRYNKYWRLPGSSTAPHAAGAGAAPEQQAEGGTGAEQQQQQQQPGDRLLFESQEDGSLSVVSTVAALGALVSALERRGARESGLYASLLRYRDQLEAGMPAGEPGRRPALHMPGVAVCELQGGYGCCAAARVVCGAAGLQLRAAGAHIACPTLG